MEQLNKSIRLYFFFALGLSVGFPCGVVGIVLGAVNLWVPLLVAGILLTVGGFYAMPILWVKFAERRGDRSLLHMVLDDKILTVPALSAQSGYAEGEVNQRLKRMMGARIFTGFHLLDGTLIPFMVEAEEPKIPNICPNCGARMTFTEDGQLCEYCLFALSHEK